MALISQTTLESELTQINSMISTYLATGQLPVAYSLPTGHSIDLKDVLGSLYQRRKKLLELVAQMDPPYVVSVGG